MRARAIMCSRDAGVFMSVDVSLPGTAAVYLFSMVDWALMSPGWDAMMGNACVGQWYLDCAGLNDQWDALLCALLHHPGHVGHDILGMQCVQ